MTSMELDSAIELYDSDFIKIEEGPLAWANQRVGSLRDLNDFVEQLKDKFLQIGFFTYVELGRECECRCSLRHRLSECPDLKMVEDAPYRIMISITSRVTLQAFDYEQMQHEVRNNILDMPGQDKGVIKFDEKEFLRRHGGHAHG